MDLLPHICKHCYNLHILSAVYAPQHALALKLEMFSPSVDKGTYRLIDHFWVGPYVKEIFVFFF